MARIDRERLEKGVFPARCEVIPRFSDLDRIDHLNNVAIADLLQEGRYRFGYDAGMTGREGRHIVLASATVEYAADLLYGSPIVVETAAVHIGRSSFQIAQVIRQNGRIAVYAEAVQVVRGDQGSMPIPDDWREKLEALTLG